MGNQSRKSRQRGGLSSLSRNEPKRGASLERKDANAMSTDDVPLYLRENTYLFDPSDHTEMVRLLLQDYFVTGYNGPRNLDTERG